MHFVFGRDKGKESIDALRRVIVTLSQEENCYKIHINKIK
jgi:hypothetical protein